MDSHSKIDRTITCPKCKYDAIDVGATECPLCQTKILTVESGESAYKRAIDKTNKLRRHSNSRSSSKSGQIELTFKNRTRNWLNFVRHNSTINSNLTKHFAEAKKPLNLVGLILLGLGIGLWINYFLARAQKVEVVEVPARETEEVDIVPQGLFNYGGDSIFAPLVASGINSAMERAYPEFELRYAKPLNEDFSSLNGIQMLLDGELSFAYNARALNSKEYQEANLRSIELKSVPIAVDGVVLYSNVKVPKSKLNRNQIKQIFSGELTNWNQIDSKIKDLPIVPVIVEDENSKLLGLSSKSEITKSAQYAGNYTQALRKTIGTPGAISFASASLVQNQKLVKIFDLADGSSANYIEPQVETFKDGTYPLTRRIYLVYREDGTVDSKAAQAYIDFIASPVGQGIVKKAKLVPIH